MSSDGILVLLLRETENDEVNRFSNNCFDFDLNFTNIIFRETNYGYIFITASHCSSTSEDSDVVVIMSSVLGPTSS